MIRPAAMLLVGQTQGTDRIIWNRVANVRLLMLIDELRDEVAAAIDAELRSRPTIEQPAPTDEPQDYGTRPEA